MDYDIVIIGAGVVGLACAATLAGKYSVLVVERNSSFGMETSSRNSEVIHAGIYYPTDSLKAVLCVRGNHSLYEWCRKYGLPHLKTGKYIIAVEPDEEENLERLYCQAVNNGVPGIERVPIDVFRKSEPNVRATAALFSPTTGIIDSHSLMKSYEQAGLQSGCNFAFRHTLSAIGKISGGYLLSVTDFDGDTCNVKTPVVINSAGLDSDTVSGMAGIDNVKEDYVLHYCRGHYFRIASHCKSLVNHLIYPVPPKDALSLGIHVTVELNGELKLGPDTQYLPERVQDYTVPIDLHGKFYSAASRYLPALKEEDITPDQAGIRPKLQKEGEGFRDFVIHEEWNNNLPGFINLIGIESPGLTASLEIARYVSEMI